MSNMAQPDKTVQKNAAEQLALLIRTLEIKHPNTDNLAFPSTEELNQLVKQVESIAKLLGVVKSGYGTLDSAIGRVDKRYQKIGLRLFVDRLAEKIGAIPIGPCKRIANALEDMKADDSGKQALTDLLALVKMKVVEIQLSQEDCESFYDVRRLIATEDFTAMLERNRPRGARDLDFDESTESLKTLVGHSLFWSLWHEHQIWMHRWDRLTKPTIQFLHSLYNDGYDNILRSVFYGFTLTPASFSKNVRRRQNREASKRNYHKSRAKK
jgi:hypothetical protein